MIAIGKEYYIYAARGNTKTSNCLKFFIVSLSTIRKKKKAFLKFLRALGYKRDTLNAYENYIKEGKGHIPYSWETFQGYILMNYCSCERSQ